MNANWMGWTLPTGGVRGSLPTSPRNALIELVLRKGLDQKIVAARLCRFQQRRAVGRGDARRDKSVINGSVTFPFSIPNASWNR